ncbi:MAG: UDP-N-acetylmuramoyl-L-alanine--D-glutamate ligase [Francisella sp.]
MSYFSFNDRDVEKLLIVGYGATGKSVCNFIKKFTRTFVDISQSDEDFINYDLDAYDLIVVSPGIPINKNPYKNLQNLKDKIISDIDIFYQCVKDRNIKTIAVTGSNGKSTVVTMLDFVLKNIGYKSVLVGNIGTPPLDIVNEDFEFCILELSSFQIDLLKSARFDLGCVINVSPDHLDRYDSFVEYKQSKLNLANFSKDFFVYDVDNTGIKYTQEYQIIKGCIYKGAVKLLDIAETNLFGQHNLENIVVVLKIFDKFGLNINKSISAIKKFKGLEHRCQVVKKINDITYIDDSKGTNVGATVAAINSITSSKNIILLLGGLAKGGDFSLMIHALEKYVKYVFIYGADKEYIENSIKNHCKYELCNNMKQAFELASNKARENDIVLLSPACASFDEFSGYAHRGEVFKNLVYQLDKNK